MTQHETHIFINYPKKEKERALDISNIYSNRNNNVNQPTTQAGAQPVSLSFKTSLNTLNSSPFETPRDKRKETDRKKKETKPLVGFLFHFFKY